MERKNNEESECAESAQGESVPQISIPLEVDLIPIDTPNDRVQERLENEIIEAQSQQDYKKVQVGLRALQNHKVEKGELDPRIRLNPLYVEGEIEIEASGDRLKLPAIQAGGETGRSTWDEPKKKWYSPKRLPVWLQNFIYTPWMYICAYLIPEFTSIAYWKERGIRAFKPSEIETDAYGTIIFYGATVSIAIALGMMWIAPISWPFAAMIFGSSLVICVLSYLATTFLRMIRDFWSVIWKLMAFVGAVFGVVMAYKAASRYFVKEANGEKKGKAPRTWQDNIVDGVALTLGAAGIALLPVIGWKASSSVAREGTYLARSVKDIASLTTWIGGWFAGFFEGKKKHRVYYVTKSGVYYVKVSRSDMCNAYMIDGYNPYKLEKIGKNFVPGKLVKKIDEIEAFRCVFVHDVMDWDTQKDEFVLRKRKNSKKKTVHWEPAYGVAMRAELLMREGVRFVVANGIRIDTHVKAKKKKVNKSKRKISSAHKLAEIDQFGIQGTYGDVKNMLCLQKDLSVKRQEALALVTAHQLFRGTDEYVMAEYFLWLQNNAEQGSLAVVLDRIRDMVKNWSEKETEKGKERVTLTESSSSSEEELEEIEIETLEPEYDDVEEMTDDLAAVLTQHVFYQKYNWKIAKLPEETFNALWEMVEEHVKRTFFPGQQRIFQQMVAQLKHAGTNKYPDAYVANLVWENGYCSRYNLPIQDILKRVGNLGRFKTAFQPKFHFIARNIQARYRECQVESEGVTAPVNQAVPSGIKSMLETATSIISDRVDDGTEETVFVKESAKDMYHTACRMGSYVRRNAFSAKYSLMVLCIVSFVLILCSVILWLAWRVFKRPVIMKKETGNVQLVYGDNQIWTPTSQDVALFDPKSNQIVTILPNENIVDTLKRFKRTNMLGAIFAERNVNGVKSYIPLQVVNMQLESTQSIRREVGRKIKKARAMSAAIHKGEKPSLEDISDVLPEAPESSDISALIHKIADLDVPADGDIAGKTISAMLPAAKFVTEVAGILARDYGEKPAKPEVTEYKKEAWVSLNVALRYEHIVVLKGTARGTCFRYGDGVFCPDHLGPRDSDFIKLVEPITGKESTVNALSDVRTEDYYGCDMMSFRIPAKGTTLQSFPTTPIYPINPGAVVMARLAYVRPEAPHQIHAEGPFEAVCDKAGMLHYSVDHHGGMSGALIYLDSEAPRIIGFHIEGGEKSLLCHGVAFTPERISRMQSVYGPGSSLNVHGGPQQKYPMAFTANAV